MRILKFGGKSLSNPQKVQNVCKFIKKIYKKDKNIIIVVSAIGQTTNKLEAFAKEYAGEKLDDSELSVLLSTGETQSSAIFAMTLNANGIPAKSLQGFQIELTTFGNPLSSKVAYLNKSILEETLADGFVAIVAGFQGVNNKGEITVLGRGGSDTTAAAIGAVFETPVEIYSDFDGVFAGDPRLFSYKKIKAISFDTMKKMAESGAKVLDARAALIAKQFGTNIVSKSSSAPTKKGSLISSIETDIVSISSKDDLCEISIIFSNESRLKFIVKNVLNCINSTNLYNLSYQNGKISILASTSQKNQIIKFLSEKLHLLKNE